MTNESGLPGRVSVGEIAEIAGVRPSAVSNWRNRHTDFPLPVEETATGDLFDLGKVLKWLDAHKKSYRRPAPMSEKAIWDAMDRQRGDIPPEDSVLSLLQVLFLRSRAISHSPNGKANSNCWKALSQASPKDALKTWERCIGEIRDADQVFQRVMRVPSKVHGKALVDVIKTIAEVDFSNLNPGRIATALLYRFTEVLGPRGIAATQESLAILQAKLLEPLRGRIYDPACGAALALAEIWRRRGSAKVNLCGQDVSEYAWRLGFLHLALNNADFVLESGDTLRGDRFPSLRADRITADPPFGVKPQGSEVMRDDRWIWGVPRGSADWLWVQVVLHHLKDRGTAVMTVAQRTLAASGTDESFRRDLVRSGVLEAVIELPPGLLARTSLPAALLVFSKGRLRNKDQVLFIDARQLGKPRRGKVHELENRDIDQIAGIVRNWRNGQFKEVPRFAAAGAADEILAEQADLTPKRYVRYSTRVTEIEGEPIADRVVRLREAVGLHALEIPSDMNRILAALSMLVNEDAGPYRRVRIGDVLAAKSRTGMRRDTKGSGPEVPFIETGAVSSGSGRLEQQPTTHTRGKTRGRLARRGDVLLASRGIDAQSRISCATVVFDGEAAYSASLLRLSPDPAVITPEYLQLFLTSRQGRTALAAATTGSVIGYLKSEALNEIEIPLPDLATQRRLGSAMKQILTSMSALEQLHGAVTDAYDAFREAAVAGVRV